MTCHEADPNLDGSKQYNKEAETVVWTRYIHITLPVRTYDSILFETHSLATRKLPLKTGIVQKICLIYQYGLLSYQLLYNII